MLHLRLPTSRFNRFLSGLGECGSLHCYLLGNGPIAQDLVAILALAEDPLGQQGLGGDGVAVLKGVQGAEIDDLQGLGKDVVETPLGDPAGQRHLAALEADADAAAAAGLLALVTAAGGLAVAGTGATALALTHMGGAGGGGQFMQIHFPVPPYLVSSTLSR